MISSQMKVQMNPKLYKTPVINAQAKPIAASSSIPQLSNRAQQPSGISLKFATKINSR